MAASVAARLRRRERWNGPSAEEIARQLVHCARLDGSLQRLQALVRRGSAYEGFNCLAFAVLAHMYPRCDARKLARLCGIV